MRKAGQPLILGSMKARTRDATHKDPGLVLEFGVGVQVRGERANIN